MTDNNARRWRTDFNEYYLSWGVIEDVFEGDGLEFRDYPQVAAMIEREADARLMAAAPALLEACKAALDGMLELYAADYGILHEIELCKAAIAQAEGRS